MEDEQLLFEIGIFLTRDMGFPHTAPIKGQPSLPPNPTSPPRKGIGSAIDGW